MNCTNKGLTIRFLGEGVDDFEIKFTAQPGEPKKINATQIE